MSAADRIQLARDLIRLATEAETQALAEKGGDEFARDAFAIRLGEIRRAVDTGVSAMAHEELRRAKNARGEGGRHA